MNLTEKELNDLAMRLSKRSHYEKGPMNSLCIVWHGATNPNGYGAMKWRDTTWSVHRLGFIHYNKRLPTKYVCHHCDNRLCWAGDHLFEGTPLDNVKDMIVKGRYTASNVKLTQDEVLLIRALIEQNQHTLQEIGDKFNIHKSTVSKIKQNQIW